jgi:F-type H+-transporting ATPase subunit delta
MGGSADKGRQAIVEHLDQVLAGADVHAETVGNELFGVAGLLDAEPSLRRTVTDPGVAGAARSALIRQVLGDRVSPATSQVVATGAGQRWPSSRDLADSLEYAGAVAHIAQAEEEGRLDDVEDELFRFERIVSADAGLRDMLNDRAAPSAGKQTLIRALLADKTAPSTRRLAIQASAGRHRSMSAALEAFAKVVAQRRERLVATVTVAQPLSEEEQTRLAEVLRRDYGRAVHLNVVVDGSILGGARIEIGDEVVDGTVLSRLENARRRVAG